MNVLIVGASSGIGRDLWRHYASLGHMVAVMARRVGLLEDMAGEFPENTFAQCCDVADCESFDRAFPEIMARLGHIDLAVVCAGVGELNPSLDDDVECATVAVNVSGWTNAVVKVYRQLEAQGNGHLVTITSVGGMQPTPVAPAYSASKAFQINYTRSLQRKAKESGILVTEVRPGLVDTRMAKGEGLFWVMPLDRVVKSVVRAIDNRSSLAIVTKRWRLINWLLKHF
ncbi:MAG: SDR family NAD(P)-dependent oxidoreductase [Paenibacillus sp.]|nr:SDR family NAD(P)-dependent oxidoreductase [Paenibacillus sp.]